MSSFELLFESIQALIQMVYFFTKLNHAACELFSTCID